MEENIIGLAAPSTACTPEIRTMLAIEGFAALADAAISRYGPRWRERGSNIDAAVTASTERAAGDFETAWSPGVGYVAEGLQCRDDCHVQVGLALTLLHAASRGMTTEWDLCFDREVRLFVQDTMLPPATTFAVRQNGGRLVVTTAGSGQPAVVELWPRCGATVSGFGIQQATTIAGSWGTIVLWPDRARLLTAAHEALESCNDSRQQRIAAGLDLLAETDPLYYHWVTWVMRRLFVDKSAPYLLRSGTLDWHFGLCTCAIPDTLRPIGVAEMLVHESSHQYFNLAVLPGPVVDPSHTTLYYSPFKGQDRPLEKLLVAYHAFANVTLFFDRYQAVTGRRVPNRLRIERGVSDLERTLTEQAEHLTPLGRALFEPLRERRADRFATARKLPH